MSWKDRLMQADLPAMTIAVLTAVEYAAGPNGVCRATQDELSQWSGASNRTVREHIKKAIDAGWLRRDGHALHLIKPERAAGYPARAAEKPAANAGPERAAGKPEADAGGGDSPSSSSPEERKKVSTPSKKETQPPSDSSPSTTANTSGSHSSGNTNTTHDESTNARGGRDPDRSGGRRLADIKDIPDGPAFVDALAGYHGYSGLAHNQCSNIWLWVRDKADTEAEAKEYIASKMSSLSQSDFSDRSVHDWIIGDFEQWASNDAGNPNRPSQFYDESEHLTDEDNLDAGNSPGRDEDVEIQSPEEAFSP